MTETLLRTKLFVPPLRPNLVSRPRLTGQLNRALDMGCGLILVSAPAGFGKTTTVSEWAAKKDLACAWLSLDKADNDPLRFLTYLAAALQTIEPAIGSEVLGELRAPGVAPGSKPSQEDAALTILLNDISNIADHFIVVLDDYHAIETLQVHEAVSFLLEHQPPNMHMIIVTRVDPPLAIARLRAHGQLTEIHAADLSFTPDETATFLNEVMGLGLTTGQLSALERRTEGWIAGLQLSALSIRGRDDASDFIQAFTGSHRYILDYLTEEVLSQQSEDVQTFLKQTSFLDRLSGSLCNAITGREDGHEVLEALEAANLFIIPLDEERRWYRYHHLFAELLRQYLRRDRRDLLPELHHRAGEWYEQNGLIPEAIDQFFASGDFEQAASLIENNAWAMLTRGEFATLLNWLHALPADLIRSRQQLMVFIAWALTFAGQLDDAIMNLAGVDDQQLQGEVLAVRSLIAGAREDVQHAIKLAHQALDQLPEDQLFLRGFLSFNLGIACWMSGDLEATSEALNDAVLLGKSAGQRYLTLMALSILGHVQEMQGYLHQAVDTHREALAQIAGSDDRPVPFAGVAYVGISEPLYEWNELERAVQFAEEGIRLSELSGRISYVLAGRLILAKVHQAQGDIQKAMDAIKDGESVARKHDIAYMASEIAELRVQLWIAEGNLAAASQWADAHSLNPAEEPGATMAREVEQRAVARVLIACIVQPGSQSQVRIEEAVRLLTRLRESAEAGGRAKSAIKIVALQALAFQAQGYIERALAMLGQALLMAKPEGYVRTFVDEGEPMAKLLGAALRQGMEPDYVARLMAEFRTPAEPPYPEGQSLIEPLSERELEVLRLIASGFSNQQIAQQLVIATSTVKSHINHIYGKLGVKSRTQAVFKGQALGFL